MSEVLGKVVHVLSPMELVVNLGSSQGVTASSRFVVFKLGDELKDPDTGEPLGQLEILRGRAEAKHVQEKMSTIRSTEKNRALRDRERYRSPLVVPEIVTEEVDVAGPFQDARVGDLVRLL